MQKNRSLVSIFLSILLASIRSQNPSKCTDGPYIYDNACIKVNQGIGATVNKMKLQILLGEVYQMKIIPVPECFSSVEHNTSLYRTLGWGIDYECSEDDVKFATNSDSSTAINIKLESGTESLQAVEELCASVQKGLNYSQVLHSLGGTWWDIHEKTKLSNQIFIVEREYYAINIEGYQCTRSFILDRYIKTKLSDSQRIESFDHRKYNIAFHFRYGDTAKPDPNYPAEANWDVNFPEQRRIPLTQGIQVLKAILGPDSVLDASSCTINFFSEGDKSVFKQLEDEFPKTRFFLGDESTVVSDLDHLASADILIGGPSSFTSLVAALNMNGVSIVPQAGEGSSKFVGINNTVSIQSILNGDLTSFNQMVCTSTLYVNSDAPKLSRC